MAFKVFDAYGAASRPEATLRANGYIFLSRGIMKRGGAEDAKFAQLSFDDVKQRIGIKLFVDQELKEDGVRPMSLEKSGAAANLLPLLRFHDLPDPKKLGALMLPVTFEEGFVVVSVLPLITAAEKKAAKDKEMF